AVTPPSLASVPVSPQAAAAAPPASGAVRVAVRPMLLARLAWVLVGFYVLVAGTGLYLGLLTRTTIGDFPIALFGLLMIVIGVWPVIGALIVHRHPRHRVGWLLLAAFPPAALDLLAVGYAAYHTSLW